MKSSLKYFLMDNPLTPDPNDHRAVTIHEYTNTEQDIINMILNRNVAVSRSLVTSVVEEYGFAMELILQNGQKIETPLFSITPRVTGVLKDKNDHFDRNCHKVKLYMHPGERLLGAIGKTQLEKIPTPQIVPIIDTFYDIKSDTSNEIATKGQPAKVFGNELKLDQQDLEQGIFFIHAGTKEETRVETVIDIKPKQLSIMIPASLSAGDYFVRVKVRHSKELHKVELPMPVSVAS